MIKSRLPVTVDMSLRRLLLFIVIISFRRTPVLIFRLQNDCPSRWEDGVMNVQLIGLEEEAAKHSSHSEGLAIGEVHKIWCHTASMTAESIY